MDRDEFKRMWDSMQSNGYFSNHSHYVFDYDTQADAIELALDQQLLSLDYSDSVEFPVPYSEALERSVKRTESYWLPRMFDLPKRGSVLDVGCGYGRSLKWLSAVYDKATGVDVSPAAIGEARKFLAGIDNISLAVSDPDKLPDDLPRSSFDFAYAFTVFQHIPRQYTQRLLADMASLLSPSGKLAFNLLTGINEDGNSGVIGTEWAIGYNQQTALELLAGTGLEVDKMLTWTGPGTDIGWIWICASKPST